MNGRKKQPEDKKLPYRRHYSVYLRKTDEPVIIHGLASECAAAMGITKSSFYRYMCRDTESYGRKYEVFVDGLDEELEDSEC